ncbi:BrnA antitoxin family protein [Treponema zuelzerae]|uniref:BrnA antitoxin family protein n=1 Tax=Teretinema zuelzerae TaxID=156 RepID=A0AAE3JHN7_9SPIR|nr:BrnA antitoxin family protein [Teretinema zuelzerae]MCD1653171.1 BrnA antitoxin family protein [Teretinema zuelzerae]
MKKVTGFKPMDEAAKKRIEALANLPDSEVDTSDIPEWTKDDFARAIPFHSLYKPRKEQITARIDADVIAWLKSFGKGYQTLMNELLRKEMMESQGKPGKNVLSTKG